MRILFISTTFPDAGSPSRGTYNAALCQALAREHDVRVVSPRMFSEVWRPFAAKRFQAPADMAAAGIECDYPTYWYTPRIWQHRYGDQMWRSVRTCVLNAIREFHPQAVLSYWAHPDGEAGLRAARSAGVPAAVIVGGTDALILPRVPRRGERVCRVLRESDAVITVSEGLREAVRSLGVPDAQVRTIYQGIDQTIFNTRQSRSESRRKLGLANGPAHLVWIGRMVPVKRLDVLLQSTMRLRSTGIDFQLHLLGDGPMRAGIERQVHDSELRDLVHLPGAVAPSCIADWYRAADVTLLTSESEGLPNVLRESLACGTPFVSTDVGSVREIAEPGASLLVPVNDPLAVCQGVKEMLTPAAQQRAASYVPRTWNDCAADTAALLEQLIAARTVSGVDDSGNASDTEVLHSSREKKNMRSGDWSAILPMASR